MEAFAHGCPEVGLELDEGNEREQSSEEEVLRTPLLPCHVFKRANLLN